MANRREFSQKLKDMLMAVSGYTSVEEFLAKYVEKYAGLSEGDRAYYARHAKANAVVHAYIEDTPNTGRVINLSAFGKIIFQGYLQAYPACCGAQMLHHFRCENDWTSAQFNPIMDQLFSELKSMGFCRMQERIIVVMVEERRMDNHTIDMDLGPVKTPQMNYKPLWDYFHTCPKVNTRLMFNVNSGNVLHDMEVILK